MYVVEESEIGVEIGDPVIFITDIDTGTELHNESLTLGLNDGGGDLTGSSSGLHHPHESDPTVPSEIQIDFGAGVTPQVLDIELRENNANGIASVITNSINSHGELSASTSDTPVTVNLFGILAPNSALEYARGSGGIGSNIDAFAFSAGSENNITPSVLSIVF